MNGKARQQIAARIRKLMGKTDVAATASYLGVDEVALRMSIDETSPYPTIDVIAAVVHGYAVDPTWVLTGEYDELSHRRALEAKTDEIPVAIRALVDRDTEIPIRANGLRFADRPAPELPG